MKEITFVCPTSKLTRTIKVCETQKELIGVIRERRFLDDGSIFVLYNDCSYFFQLLGSDGHKAGQFKRCGIKAATASSFSGELFVFGDFSITPDGLVCIGEENIKKYGLYSGQYDVKPEKVETDTTDFDEIRQAYNKAIDDIKHNYYIDEECRQAVICSKIKQLDFINHLWEHGVYYDFDGFFSRKVNLYNLKTGDFDITVEPPCYYDDDYILISSEPEAAIRFALYLLGR